MEKTSQMTRWTMPTDMAFFEKHKGAIKNATFFALLAHLVWAIYAVKPCSAWLFQYVEASGVSFNVVMLLAFILIAFVHYRLATMIEYGVYVHCDKDDNTNLRWTHYVAPVFIIIAFLMIDITNITSSFHNDDEFEGQKKYTEQEKKEERKAITDIYNSDVTDINTALNAKLNNIRADYAISIQAIKSRKTYDAADVKKRAADLKKEENARDAAITASEAEAADEKMKLLNKKNADIAALDSNTDNKLKGIASKQGTSATKAHAYGWIISVVCLIAVFFFKIQEIDLRVEAGQKLVHRYSIEDATGSFSYKMSEATKDIFDRAGHCLASWYHRGITSHLSDLSSLDGAFKLDGQEYGKATTPSVPAPSVSASTATAPPPPPPSDNPPPPPPPSDPTPPTAPTPSPSNGIEVEETQRNGLPPTVDLPMPKAPPQKVLVGRFDVCPNDLKSGYIKHLSKVRKEEDVIHFLTFLNPEIFIRGGFLELHGVEQHVMAKLLSDDYRFVSFNDLNTDAKIDCIDFFVNNYDTPPQATGEFLATLSQKIHVADRNGKYINSFFGDMPIPSQIMLPPTPSVSAAKSTVATVPQLPQLPQVKTVDKTSLDAELRAVIEGLGKNSESHFTREDIKDKSGVAFRIFKLIDKGCQILCRAGNINTVLLNKFSSIANDRIALCSANGFTYSAVEDLNKVINQRLGKEVHNG